MLFETYLFFKLLFTDSASVNPIFLVLCPRSLASTTFVEVVLHLLFIWGPEKAATTLKHFHTLKDLSALNDG
jgi:hypothetical protein